MISKRHRKQKQASKQKHRMPLHCKRAILRRPSPHPSFSDSLVRRFCFRQQRSHLWAPTHRGRHAPVWGAEHEPRPEAPPRTWLKEIKINTRRKTGVIAIGRLEVRTHMASARHHTRKTIRKVKQFRGTSWAWPQLAHSWAHRWAVTGRAPVPVTCCG